MKTRLFLTAAAITFSLTVSAQSYTVRRDARGHTIQLPKDSIQTAPARDPHMFNAAKCLKKSASADIASLSMAVVAGVAYSGAAFDDRATCNTIGTLLAAGAIVTKVFAISWKSEAGRELRLSATGVTITF